MKRLILPLAAALLAVACSSDAGSDTAATTTTGGATAATTTTGTTTAGTPATGAATGFAAVATIANNQCMPCHSAEKHAGGLSLASHADLMKGGEHGASVKPGDPENSLLVKVLKGSVEDPHVDQMPLKRAPMSAADIQKISDWIKAGANA